MKKSLYAFLALSVFLASCSSSSDKEETQRRLAKVERKSANQSKDMSNFVQTYSYQEGKLVKTNTKQENDYELTVPLPNGQFVTLTDTESFIDIRYENDKLIAMPGYMEIVNLETMEYVGGKPRATGDTLICNLQSYQTENGKPAMRLEQTLFLSENDAPDKRQYRYSNNFLVDRGALHFSTEQYSYNATSMTQGLSIKGYTSDKESEFVITIEYLDQADKLGMSIIPHPFPYGEDDNGLKNRLCVTNVLYQMGYMGKRSAKLIKSIRSTRRNGAAISYYSYEYELDKHGYPIKIKESKENEYIGTYTLTYL